MSKRSNLIKTVPEVMREVVYEHMRAAGLQFQKSIRPAYKATAAGAAEHIGSCILLKLHGVELLVTAAHVLDSALDSFLYVGGEERLVPIDVTGFLATEKPGGNRQDDHFDFAITKIPPDKVGALGAVKFITEQELCRSRDESAGHVFTAIGYPHSKNKKIDHVNKRARYTIWKYSATRSTVEETKQKLNVSGKDHVFIRFDKKHSQNELGEVVNSANPQGASGGGLFDLGNLAHPARITERPNACLKGLLIEVHARDGTMVSTRMHKVVDEARRVWGL
jgi:hypothetical protein